MARDERIELPSSVLETDVLPLNESLLILLLTNSSKDDVAVGTGFEPARR